MASTTQDKRAQETAKALRMESLSLFDQCPKSNSGSRSSNGEVTNILDGFQLILSENIQPEPYHSYLFDDYLEAAC